jgi:hypothetical protein
MLARLQRGFGSRSPLKADYEARSSAFAFL